MARRHVWLLVAAVLVAGVCVRLGVWQLERLAERRSYNTTVLSASALPAVDLDSLPAGDPPYRQVIVRGRYDSGRELVLANRPRRGSPGVHILTPLVRAGSDTAVLVVRGWVYAPDAAHPELARWREDSARGAVGYIRSYDAPVPGQRAATTGAILRHLDHGAAAEALPYPLAPYLVVLTGDGADTVSERPPRLDSPALGEGPHLSYAFQWFAFAAVAIAGTLVFIRQSSRQSGGRSDHYSESP